jgi:hypothetical protein
VSLESYFADLARYNAKRIENREARSAHETDRERMLNDLRDQISEYKALFNLEHA